MIDLRMTADGNHAAEEGGLHRCAGALLPPLPHFQMKSGVPGSDTPDFYLHYF
jgi:hypothetical protein